MGSSIGRQCLLLLDSAARPCFFQQLLHHKRGLKVKLIDKLKRDLREMGAEIEVDPDTESYFTRCITVFAPKWKAWRSHGLNAMVEPYADENWRDMRGAIKEIRERISMGIEDASQDTIDAMGWENDSVIKSAEIKADDDQKQKVGER